MPLDFIINPVSSRIKPDLQAKIDQKTKPLGALGQLESLALKIGLIQNTLAPKLTKPTILIFAGDHGIVESGVSTYPQSVTAQMVANFLSGGAAISVFARQHSLDLMVVDAGVNADLLSHPQLIDAKIAKGTKNFLTEPAMTSSQCETAIQKGAELVMQQHQVGCNCIGFGEMGIGNTSSAALLVHCLADMPLAQCVGRGTGLDDSLMRHKHDVLQQALDFHNGLIPFMVRRPTEVPVVQAQDERNQPTTVRPEPVEGLKQNSPDITEPLDVLATFGGFEIAMMMGAYLKAAELGMLILVDGFIASAALLVAYKLYPAVLDYCVFSHVSSEQGHQALLATLNAKPLLNLELRLGEGSGIALAYPLVQSAVLFLNEMSTFADAGVDCSTQS
ncbi:nicotinate-nucleotide--dimethylbenzimidazole phosphoribosyltransferase [Methyloglobulus sp.]|uniref:nicotinate-nucleotide--dimethylbenzimidazole phosphoribosyltransferase n=1 Tax=Methyloglobulus sp. TaxID=2518622 RepID=UPI0032B795B2